MSQPRFLEKYGEAIIFENVQVDITNLLDREGIRYAEEPFIGQNKSGYLMFDDIKNGKQVFEKAVSANE